MKKLFALIFAAVLFAGCSNNVDNNDAVKFALFSRQNTTEKYSLKINLFAEQSRTITPFDSDEAYVNAVSKVEKWDLVFTDINDESNNFSIIQLRAKNGVLLVETEKTGNFKVEISGSIEIDGTKYNFYGLKPSVGLSDTPGETLEFSAPVGLAKAGGKGNFSGKVTLDEYWEISNKEFSEGGVPGDLFKILLVSKTNNETIELTPEYDSITDESGVFTGFAFNMNDIPSDYYQLKVSFSGYNGKKPVEEVVFDKGNLVVIGDGLTTRAELLACYSQPVTQIVDTYYACNDKESQGNGLYPQTKGYAWGIIKNIFEYTEKEAGTYTVYCDAFVIDAVEYKALKGISSKNGVVNILYSNGKCTIEYNNGTGYKLSVERCFAVSAKDFVGTEAEPFPVLEIDEHNTKNLYTSVTYENFVAVVLKVTDFAGINPRNTKINYYINDTETFLYNTPFFVYYSSDPEMIAFEQNYEDAFVYIKRNGEYQYAPSYRLRLFTDDDPMPEEGYNKLDVTDPDAANYKQFYLSVKPSVQFIDPEQKYFIGSNSKTEGDYIIYAPKHKFQVYADSNCENPVNDDKLTYTWYLNGKDVSSITGNNSFVVLSEEYDDLNLYGENNIECIITDGSIMKTADKTFKFSMPVEQRVALYHAKDSNYSILKYYNTVSGMTYNTNIKITDYYKAWFFMDGTSLCHESGEVDRFVYRTQALNGEFVEMPCSNSFVECLSSQGSLHSLTKDVATGKIWLYYYDDNEKVTKLSVIENPNDEDCKFLPGAILDSNDSGACIAVYNDKVYVFRTTNKIDIYSVEKDTRKGLKFSEKTTVNTGIPLLFENPRVMDFAVVPVVPYNGGVRAVVCISQIFDNMFTPEDFTEGTTHKMYSLGSVSSFDLDESGNISNLKSNLGYNKSETDNQNYNYKDYDNNSINYQINFIVSDSEKVGDIPVIFGKTKILAIKEDEVILSDVGVYSYVDADKKRLRRKSHLVKYDFNKLYDLDSDVNISFDINNISGSIGEWEEDIRN